MDFGHVTRSKSIAEIFSGVGNTTNIDDNQPVLFEITVDIGVQSLVFADISEFSQIPEEVLLALGTVFQSDDIVYDDADKYWNIQVTPSDKGRGNHYRTY